MSKRKPLVVLASGLAFFSVFIGGRVAWSADDTIAARTERSESEVSKGPLQREVVGIKPQVGIVAFTDSASNADSRVAAGLVVEMNAVTTFFKENSSLKNWYIGPSSGAIFSHLGDPGSNYFGANASSSVGQSGSNFLIVPMNLKVGYLFPESNLRVSLRAGGNFTYRTIADSMDLGPATAGQGAVWRIYPNVGADLEVGSFMFRPDLTMTPGNRIFSGTVGLNISLG